MVTNTKETLSVYPLWVVAGYENAQNMVSNSMSGSEYDDAIKKQDEVIYNYWKFMNKLPKGNQWNQDWFFSDIHKSISKEKNPAKLKGLHILKQSISDSHVADLRGKEKSKSHPSSGSAIGSFEDGGSLSNIRNQIKANPSAAVTKQQLRPEQQQAAMAYVKEINDHKNLSAQSSSNIYLYVGIAAGVFLLAVIGGVLIYNKTHQTP